MKILYLIPARKGSKGVPGKNIKLLAGKPLIAYSIEIALQLASPEDICISTNCDDVVAISKELGVVVPFKRPEELATDKSGTYEVILHALKYYRLTGKEYEYVMLLQPTSPFRKISFLRDVIELAKRSPEAEMIVSVKESKENPYFNLFEEDQLGYLKKSKEGEFHRRQDCPNVYAFNGSIYLMKTSSLEKRSLPQLKSIVKYVMPDEYSIDIDSQRDWMLAEFTLKNFLSEQ